MKSSSPHKRFYFKAPVEGQGRKAKGGDKMARFFENKMDFEANFYEFIYNDTLYIELDKRVAAKLLLYHEIFWETYQLPDIYGTRPYLSMDPTVDKCLIGVYMGEDIPMIWNASYSLKGMARVTYNTFAAENSAEEFCEKYNFTGLAHQCWVINEIFAAMDYFCGIDDEAILGRFAPEYVYKFIERHLGWYTPNKCRDLFELTARDLIDLGVVKPGRELEPEDED